MIDKNDSKNEVENDDFILSLEELDSSELINRGIEYLEQRDEEKFVSIFGLLRDFNEIGNHEKIVIRKAVYDIYIKNKIFNLNKDVLCIFEKIINSSNKGEEKLNLVFIRLGINYLKNEKPINCVELHKWLTYFPVQYLNHEPYGEQKYSEYDLYYYDLFKCICELEVIQNVEIHYPEIIENIKNEELINFTKYNMCKMFFAAGKNQEGMEILKNLLLYNRKKYYLYLPLKYKVNDKNFIYSSIIELLQKGIKKDEQYIYKYIVDWLKENLESGFYNSINENVSYDEKKHIQINNYQDFSKKIFGICKAQIKEILKKGKVVNITKSGNAFIKSLDDNNTMFVSKEYSKRIKVNQIIEYFEIESFDDKKKQKSKAAIVLGGI